MTPEIEAAEHAVLEADGVLKERRTTLQKLKDDYWTAHFTTQGIVERETVVIARVPPWNGEVIGVISWTNRIHPCIIRRNSDGSTPRRYYDAIRLGRIVKCLNS